MIEKFHKPRAIFSLRLILEEKRNDPRKKISINRNTVLVKKKVSELPKFARLRQT
ncbi:MAG: hypothetical protein ACFE9Y_01590 [Promethearchaeota archaeon]